MTQTCQDCKYRYSDDDGASITVGCSEKHNIVKAIFTQECDFWKPKTIDSQLNKLQESFSRIFEQ
jgi:hypothetical protein